MKKRQRPEQIVGKLRQADVGLGKGLKVPQVCKQLGISEQTYYRWRHKSVSHPPLAEVAAGPSRPTPRSSNASGPSRAEPGMTVSERAECGTPRRSKNQDAP